MSADSVRTSMTLPFTSSPHWAPTRTMFWPRRRDTRRRGSESDELRIQDVPEPPDLLEHLGRHVVVDVQAGDGGPPRPIPPVAHAGDVDLRLAEQRPERPDEAGPILVLEDEHVALGD